MPSYDYRCGKCGYRCEHRHAAGDRLVLTCPSCNSVRLDWCFPTPAIRTDATFQRGSDDGFGTDTGSRKIAHAKARAAGVNPTGKRFCPQLCPQGERYSPKAWINGRSDVKRICEENNWGAAGSVNVKQHQEEFIEKPYRVADDIVEREVQDIVEHHGGDVTPPERKRLVEETRENLLPRDGVPG